MKEDVVQPVKNQSTASTSPDSNAFVPLDIQENQSLPKNSSKRPKTINIVVATLVLIYGITKIFNSNPLNPLNILGIFYFVITGVFLLKKPKIGYILLAIAIVALFASYLILLYVNSY